MKIKAVILLLLVVSALGTRLRKGNFDPIDKLIKIGETSDFAANLVSTL